jgi:hypothetical protein
VNSWHRDTGDHVAVVLALLQAGAKAPEITPGSEPSAAVLEVLKNPPK